MKFALPVLPCLALCASAHASLTLLGGPSAATHVGNFVTNGSFETGAPTPGTPVYWATGTIGTPFSAVPGWTSSGPAGNYALWGNNTTSPARIAGSDILPDGINALYFGNGLPTGVDQPATFLANGAVTFPAAPNFFPKYGAPVVLTQSVPTDTNPAASYLLSFWASGEFAEGAPGAVPDGIFGLQVTNVLPGDPVQYFTAPGGGVFGASHRYDFSFVPLNPLLPVSVSFYNYGHCDLSPFGGASFTTELVLDDVIVNTVVPEPVAGALISTILLIQKRRR